MSCRLLGIILLMLIQVPALAVQNFTVTRDELAMMPPYCTAYYGHFVGLPRLENSPLRNTIPPGCPSLHHYCDGLKAMIRVDKYGTESKHWLRLAIQSFRTAAHRKDWSSCSLKPEAYMNLGKALLRKSRREGTSTAEGIANLMKAIELKPDYIQAYSALSYYYSSSGDKEKALSVVTDGLRHVPESKWLLQRFKKLGGKTPPTPITTTTEIEPPEATKGASVPQQQKSSEKDVTVQSSDSDASSSENKVPEKNSSQKIGSPTNPWCRFCPPE